MISGRIAGIFAAAALMLALAACIQPPTVTVTVTVAPTPTATTAPTVRPTRTPTLMPTITPTPPPTVTPTPIPLALRNLMPAGPAPVPGEVAPSDWKTYHNGHYGYSIAHPFGGDVEVKDKGTAVFGPSDYSFALAQVYILNDRDTLENFANRSHDNMEDSQDFDVFRFTEYTESGRNFYRINYRISDQSNGGCVLYGVKQISLSYAFPVKPYGYIVDFAYCSNDSDSLSNRDAMLDSFREWDFYQSESQGWSISIIPGWTPRWVPSRAMSV